ncbi:MAG TPA: hypothetical protein VIC07_02450 [Acidimicrobiia bacterium]
MRVSQWCDHKPTWVGRVAISACADCARVDWFSDSGPIDHAEALAYLFGGYDLIGHLDALGGPTRSVLAYSAPSTRARKHLDALPRAVWLEVGPRLWLAHDGEVLLLATDHQLLIENLTRGA